MSWQFKKRIAAINQILLSIGKRWQLIPKILQEISLCTESYIRYNYFKKPHIIDVNVAQLLEKMMISAKHSTLEELALADLKRDLNKQIEATKLQLQQLEEMLKELEQQGLQLQNSSMCEKRELV